MNYIIIQHIDRLIDAFDKDIKHLDYTLDMLTNIRERVIKRDEDLLKQILGQVKTELENYALKEQVRNQIRAQIASIIGCNPIEANISKITEYANDTQKKVLVDKQSQLRKLVTKLKDEHLSTVMFLQTCAKINEGMLKSMFRNRETASYDSRGRTKYSRHGGVVNLQY